VETDLEKHNETAETEQIEITISEDYGDGHLKTLDATLNLLFADELELLLPSTALEDDEAHLIETTRPGGNHALQDYQMQLMLIEQQNKKRLLLARQEQDNIENTSAVGVRNGRNRPGVISRRTHVSKMKNFQGPGQGDASWVAEVMPGQDGHADTSHIMKKRKRRERSHSQNEVDEKKDLIKSNHSNVQQGVSSLVSHSLLLMSSSLTPSHRVCHLTAVFFTWYLAKIVTNQQPTILLQPF
jgi:hypothetical protein